MTPAEKRDATLRTVELPDCCGNCRYYLSGIKVCDLTANYLRTEPNQLCDLHERKTGEGK